MAAISNGRERISWTETRKRLRQDRGRICLLQRRRFGYSPVLWWLDPSFVAVLFYRLSHYCWRRHWTKLGRLLMQTNTFLTGVDIHPASDIQGGLLIPSPAGVNISGKIGENVTLMPLSGTGDSLSGEDIGAGKGLPILEDNVVVNSFTGIQGAIRIGSNVCIMPGAKATSSSVPSDAVVELAVRPERGVSRVREGHNEAGCAAGCECGKFRYCLDALSGDVDRYLEKLFEYNQGSKNLVKTISALLTNQLITIALYRLSHFFYVRGWHKLSFTCCRLNTLINKATIHPGSCLGRRLFMPHPVGMVFSGRAGSDLTLYANIVCGPRTGALATPLSQAPILGDRVIVTGQAGIIGPVSIANDTLVTQKTQLTEDTTCGAMVYTSMARSVIRPGEINKIMTAERVSMDSTGPMSVKWRTVRERLREDRCRIDEAATRGDVACSSIGLLFPAYLCVLLFRLSNYCYANGHRRLARGLWLINVGLTGGDIWPASEIGGGLYIPHPASVSIFCKAGLNLTVMAQSCIGTLYENGSGHGAAPPILGNNVSLQHHSGVFGAVTLGSNVVLSSGCIVTEDVDGDTELVARCLRMRSLIP